MTSFVFTDDTVLDYADLFSVTLHSDNGREFDTRWDEILLSMMKIPSDDILESLYKLWIRESERLQERIWIVWHGNSPEDVDAQLSEIEKSGEKKFRSKTSTPDMWKAKQVQWSRVTGDYVVLKEEEVFVTSGKKKESVWRETNVVSGMRVTIVQNRYQKPRHPLSHNLQKHEVEVCWEKEMPETEASLRNSIAAV